MVTTALIPKIPDPPIMLFYIDMDYSPEQWFTEWLQFNRLIDVDDSSLYLNLSDCDLENEVIYFKIQFKKYANLNLD